MAVYCISFLVYIVLLSHDDGMSASIHIRDIHKETGKIQRVKRYNDCLESSAVSENGHCPLEKEKIEVEFLLVNQSHVARVRWKIPTVNKVPIAEFTVIWWGYNRKCKRVSNETSTYDIRPSRNIWKYDLTLDIAIIPVPLKGGENNIDFLTFTPPADYKVFVHAQSTTAPNITSSDSTTTSHGNRTSEGDYYHQDEYGSKLIVGSVIGVAMAIVLIILLVYCKGDPPPPPREDIYYISYFPETVGFVKEVKEFVDWLISHGFNVQMLTDEEDLLSQDNRNLRREVMTFKFRDHMLKTADKVFIILSPTYIKLCEMEEKDAKNENLTEDEKLLNEEILQIRIELYRNRYRCDQYIPLLFRRSKAANIPFWMMELVTYSWPEDKTNNRLLNRLNDLPECSPNNFA